MNRRSLFGTASAVLCWMLGVGKSKAADGKDAANPDIVSVFRWQDKYDALGGIWLPIEFEMVRKGDRILIVGHDVSAVTASSNVRLGDDGRERFDVHGDTDNFVEARHGQQKAS